MSATPVDCAHEWQPISGVTLDSLPPIEPYRCAGCGEEAHLFRDESSGQLVRFITWRAGRRPTEASA